jgi:glycosyltransferase involved in cell wall biosynthesis
MRKVLVILDSLCIGGRERITVDLYNAFDPAMYNITIITLSCNHNPLRGQLNTNINFYALPIQEKEIIGLRSVSFLFKGVPLLTKLINQCNPDIIHTHSALHRLILVNIAIKRARRQCKYFHTIHISGLYFSDDSLMSRIKREVERLAFKLVKPRLVAVSSIIQENNINYYGKSIIESRYIPNGLNMLVFDRGKYKYPKEQIGLKKNDLAIVYPARFVEGKNHMTLLKAFKKVKAVDTRVKLLLPGDGEMKPVVEAYVNSHQMQEQVFFLGTISNIPEILSISDIGIFPSEFEGFSMAFIEMMAMELPIIASDIPIFRHLIDHMNNGLIYPVFDEEVLAENILLLLKDEQLRISIGKNARETARQYSLERTVNSLISYYET